MNRVYPMQLTLPIDAEEAGEPADELAAAALWAISADSAAAPVPPASQPLASAAGSSAQALALLLAVPPHAAKLPEPVAAHPQVLPALRQHAHPQANRHMELAGVAIGYHHAIAPRRSIGMSVGPHGLQVRAPRWVSQAQVQEVLRTRAEWIVDKLRHQLARSATPAPPQTLAPGQVLQVLGRRVLLRAQTGPATQSAAPRTRVTLLHMHADAASPHAPELALAVALPADAAPERWQAAVLGWQQALARRHFTAQLDHFAPQVGVQWARMGLTNARTRWGSASSSGTIRLHWRLIQLPPELADYVIVHELAHLREMNHSPRFWAVVQAVMPDYAVHRQTLKQIRLASPA